MTENGSGSIKILWHQLSLQLVLKKLDAGRLGLSDEEVQRRQLYHGTNELKTIGGETAWGILLAQFKNILIILLLIATLVSAFLGHGIEAAAITIIVLFAIIHGFVQEYRAGNALKALQKMTAPRARVLRDGRECEVASRELVTGGLVQSSR